MVRFLFCWPYWKRTKNAKVPGRMVQISSASFWLTNFENPIYRVSPLYGQSGMSSPYVLNGAPNSLAKFASEPCVNSVIEEWRSIVKQSNYLNWSPVSCWRSYHMPSKPWRWYWYYTVRDGLTVRRRALRLCLHWTAWVSTMILSSVVLTI